MGNQPSSVGPTPASTYYQSSTLPGSFFTAETSNETPSPPYSDTTTRFPSTRDAVVSDKTMIVFKTSDAEHLTLSHRDIEGHTGALMPEDWSPGRTIDLVEKSSTLRVLFQFIGPHQHPNLLNQEFDFLMKVAEAAEKYKVFSAMNMCSERIRSFGDRHPKLVFLYAANHDYPHIADECARSVVTSENIECIIPRLPEHLRLSWLRYHVKWCEGITKVTCYSDIPSDAWASSNCWRNCGRLIFQALGMGVHSLNKTSWLFVDQVKSHTSGCKKCADLCTYWKAHAETVIGNISPLSETYKEFEWLVSRGDIESCRPPAPEISFFPCTT